MLDHKSFFAALSLGLTFACAPTSKSDAHTGPPPPPNTPSDVVTLFGGLDRERVQGVQVLGNGNIVIAGETTSDFLALPEFQHTLAPPFDSSLNVGGNPEGYVAILDPDLQNILYWTYLGGEGPDRAYFATDDAGGNIWVCGFTGSHAGMAEPFPVGNESHCFKPGGCGGNDPTDWDIFVVKLRFDLSGPLLATTLIGGSLPENPRGTLTVSGGFVYVSGGTPSLDFPVTAGMPVAQANTGSLANICSSQHTLHDAFVAQLSALDGSVIWCRTLGGNGDDSAWAGVRSDPNTGDIFIAGNTTSVSFSLADPGVDGGATVHRYDSLAPGVIAGASDGFVARLSSTGGVRSVGYLGGTGKDLLAVNDGLELDGQGRPVVTGMTRSGDLATTSNAVSAAHSNLLTAGGTCPNPPDWLADCAEDSNDVFVAKLSADLSTAIFVSYVNAAAGTCPRAYYREEPSGLALYGDSIVISGETDSPGFPMTPTGFDTQISSGVTPPASIAHDAFLVSMHPGPQGRWNLDYETFFGGDAVSLSADEPGNRARCLVSYASGPRAGMVLFCGQTTAADFGALTTAGVVFSSWLPGDERNGFIALHSTSR